MRGALAIAALVAACDGPWVRLPGAQPGQQPGATRASSEPVGSGRAAGGDTVVLSVVATNDVHGRIERVAVLAGHVENLRRVRAADAGAVLLVDAGDAWQGTLESNLSEGAAMVRAYAEAGYHAMAIGNHEFDYGPVGPRATPSGPGDDPRGALLERAREAPFALLAANLVERASGRPVQWPGVRERVLLEMAGIRVGLTGVTTEETPSTTIAANVADLAVRPLAEAVREQASALRREGAHVVVVLAHAGGACRRSDAPDDLSSCRTDSEIFRLARALPQGLVDVIAAGHTHDVVAHRVHGVAIVESWANGRGFGRVDLVLDRATRRVLRADIHPPRELCRSRSESLADCRPEPYEGAPVRPSERVLRAIAPYLEAARAVRDRSLGVRLPRPVRRDYDEESPLGNLVVDLMLRARPGADVALYNGGGLRDSLPAGELTYGSLYEALPFDNRFATVLMTGRELERVFERNLRGGRGILSVAGVRVVARCEGTDLDVELLRPDGQPVRDDEPLRVLTSDFVATGGDDVFEDVRRRPGAVVIEDEPPIREEIARLLEARGGEIRADDPALFDRQRPRIVLPGRRPVRCPTP
ncbi:MAG: bifunctional metallophosphatase/5'-nucleotidase [Myxococcota bacterium]|nr:bifunctional metallophosphatase/5'-nucleotidase [Myxococcota bacterium]